jgi:hypothetical protein
VLLFSFLFYVWMIANLRKYNHFENSIIMHHPNTPIGIITGNIIWQNNVLKKEQNKIRKWKYVDLAYTTEQTAASWGKKRSIDGLECKCTSGSRRAANGTARDGRRWEGSNRYASALAILPRLCSHYRLSLSPPFPLSLREVVSSDWKRERGKWLGGTGKRE